MEVDWGNIDENDPSWDLTEEDRGSEDKKEEFKEKPSAEELAEEEEVRKIAEKLEAEERISVLKQIAEDERREKLEVEEVVRRIEQEERAKEQKAKQEREKEREKEKKKEREIVNIPERWRTNDQKFSHSPKYLAIDGKNPTLSDFVLLHKLDEACFTNRLKGDFSWKEGLSWPEEYKNITREDIQYISKVINLQFQGSLKTDGPFLLCVCLRMKKWQTMHRESCLKILSYHDARPCVLSEFEEAVFKSRSWLDFQQKYLPCDSGNPIESRSIDILQHQWMEFSATWLLYEHNKFPLYKRRLSPLTHPEFEFIIQDVKKFALNVIQTTLLSAHLYKDVIELIMEYSSFAIQACLLRSNVIEEISWIYGNITRSSHKTYLEWLEKERRILKDYVPNFQVMSGLMYQKLPYNDDQWVATLFKESLFVDYPFISNETNYSKEE